MERKISSLRISRSSEIILEGGIEEVFPLFGAIEEKKWAHGWQPEVIYPPDQNFCENMIFKTQPSDLFSGEEDNYLWVVSKFQPEKYIVSYIVKSEERIWLISISCKSGLVNSTIAKVTYTFTGLSEKGNVMNKKHLEYIFEEDLQDWQTAINDYLSKTMNK